MIILASNSPRRKQLLAKLTKQFDVIPSSTTEVTTASRPCEACKELACRKAIDVFAHLPSNNKDDAVVIGCDTVVDVDGVVFGKPVDADDAKRMLRILSGREHFVHTGYCLTSRLSVEVGVATTKVVFRTLTENDIDNYVNSGAPLDKAGAYGIQETDFVQSVQGSYDNVVGFPTEQIAELLERWQKV